MTETRETSHKKGVFIRVPQPMYEDLLNLAAAATLLQRRSISVPTLILELLGETLAKPTHLPKRK